MRNEEIITSAELDDRCQLGLNNLRKGFRELYDEIDHLSHRASLDEEATKMTLEHKRKRQRQQIDDLLAYARTFIREARSSIVTFDEHGVQCEVEEKRNKKVATPSSWMKIPEPVVPRIEPVEENAKQRYSIQITHIEQLRISRATSPQTPLNNNVSVEQPKEVRNIGTNVNFVTQRAVKRTNMQGYMMPVNRPCPRRAQSVGEQPSQTVLKPRQPATAPASISRRPRQPSVRTFTDDQFKLLFDRFLSMQSEKGNSGDNISAKPAEEIQKKELCENVQHEPQNASDVAGDVGKGIEIVISSANEPRETVDDADLVTSSEMPKLSRHALPSVTIQGRWDANLKVQQTGNINIMDVKDDQAVPNSNIQYIELWHGHTRPDAAIGERIKSSEFVKETNLGVAIDSLKLNNENGTSEQAETSVNKESSPKTSHQEIEVSSNESSAQQEKSVVLVPRSVCKSARAALKLGKTRNKYLEPFLKRNCREKSNSVEVLEASDDDTSGISDNEDSGEEDLRLLLNLNDGTSNESSRSVAEPQESYLKMPETVQCQRSLLEVSSIPALRSPSKSSIQNNSKSSGSLTPTSDGDIISNQNESNERFLSKLRIWNTAVEAQSQNMNLGNQLTETIDVIKQNIQKITLESSNIVKMTEQLKSKATERGPLWAPRINRRQSVECTPSPTMVRPRSCECFGCQSTFEEPAARPLSSQHGHKNFQRALFEQNPRYSKTIKKICALGSSERWGKRSDIADDRTEKAKRAAQIFLKAFTGKSNDKWSYNSPSTPETPHSRSNDSNDSFGFGSCCSLSDTVIESRIDSLPSSSSTFEVHSSSSECDLASIFQTQCTIKSDESLASTLFRNGGTISDEGEILSHGEVK